MTGERKYWFYLLVIAAIGIVLMWRKHVNIMRLTQLFNKLKSPRYVKPVPPKNVLIVNTPEECISAVGSLNKKCVEYNALGFDCEWVTVDKRRNPVALLQLATRDGFCVLIRLFMFENNNVPVELKMLLENHLILKAGVVPLDDAKYLYQDYGIIVRGCLDVRYLTERNGGICEGGLSGLSEKILGVKLDKSWKIRCSNWEDKELTERQISYAANDALSAINIFEVASCGQKTYLSFKIMQWVKTIQNVFLNFSWNYSHSIPNFVYNYADIKYHRKSFGTNKAMMNNASLYSTKQKPNKSKPLSRAFSSRQTPLYRNCFMQAPDGEVLCTCDGKKAMWYVSKGLADVVTEDPLIVRLKFEPSGRAVGTVGEFYALPKSNCCVVCGKMDNGVRKNVVPHEYRRHFPMVMKNHVSHDIVLLCISCHLKSNGHDLGMKYRLADLCNAPFCQGENTKYLDDRYLSSVRVAAKALIRSGDRIPEERRNVLETTVKQHFGAAELNDKILQEAANIKSESLNEEYNPHGLKVVDYFSVETNGGLAKLEQMWREHFLETMEPKHMPNLWSVTHTQERLSIRAAENRILAEDLRVAGLTDCISLLEASEKSENVQ